MNFKTYPIPYRATLRVFEPITAFSEEERSRYLTAPISVRSRIDEERANLIRTILGKAPQIADDGIHILDSEGVRYLSPWKSAVRTFTAFNEFKNQIPDSLLAAFVPPTLASALNSQGEIISYVTPYALEETWMIPPRWFALFSEEDCQQGKIDEQPFVHYRTKITKAKERCRFTHSAVVNSFGVGPIEHEIELLLQWLDSFHPDSIVELDYGGLAYYLELTLLQNGQRGLVDDTSVADIQSSLAGLASGDGSQAGIGYERLIRRWRAVAEFEQSM